MGLSDPEGLGVGTRRPLVPQEVAHLPLQSIYVQKKWYITLKAKSFK
ncbi:hypothetical protein ACQCVP_06685 [Rossellomorea vietnamensis]